MEKLAVIGIGRLGLCFALQLEKAGYDVLGIDINEEYVQAINDKRLNSEEPGVEEMLKTAFNMKASILIEDVFAFLPKLIFVAVNTPSKENGSYDHSQIDFVLESVLAMNDLPSRIDLVINCTTMPGYCDSIRAKAIEKNIYISYNPEFIAQGTIMRNLQYPDQVLIGEADAASGEKIESVYKRICLNDAPVFRVSALSAEITKLATNCFLTMKIAFANAIGDLAIKTGADPEKTLAAIGADSRIGTKFLRYGYGYGGPCFPRDNRALGFFAQSVGYDLLQCSTTDAMNRKHLEFQLNQMLEANDAGEPVHFHTVTYKPDSVILEESQQLALAYELANSGRRVVVHERESVIVKLRKRFGDLFKYDLIDNGKERP